MKRYPLACCFFPTTVILVDDNTRYLTNVSLKLDQDLSYYLIDKPLRAIEHVQQASKNNSFLDRYYARRNVLEQDQDGDIALINYSAIYQEINNAKRFAEISTLLVDYAMPSMNGIELCKQLANSTQKKALVTGQADHEIAINAFNAGLIDKFIIKDAPDFFNIINNTIHELQAHYFTEMSQPIMRNLPATTLDFFHSPQFRDLFNTLCLQHNIMEYYLIDASGSYLMLDKNSKPYWFIVRNDEDLLRYYQIANDNDAPQLIISKLKRKEVLPFFFTQTDQTTPVYAWEKLLHPATKLTDNYYYTFLKGNTNYQINNEQPVLAYEEYI